MGKTNPIWIVLGIVLVIAIAYISMSNQLVALKASVDEGQARLQACYQERADLIPNLVATVQGSAAHETNIINSITESRKSLQSAIDAGDVSKMEQLNSELTRSINVLVEAYPEVTATQNFISLQDQLEGQENRIRVARNEYSEKVANYNRKIQSFPLSIVASSKGYLPISYYQANEGSENSPKIDFSNIQ